VTDINNIILEAYTHQYRNKIKPGTKVSIVLKKDQGTNKRVIGIVKDLLTKKNYHSRGIKVRLQDGQIGRVQKVLRY
jgi:uncharacterized repeat protein (TIGR03833 family)